MATSENESFRVLFVCSANLCRSVTAAEYATRAAELHTSGPIEWYVASAGTDVEPGQRLPDGIARAMSDLEIPVHKQPLMITEEHVRSADLILTAERHHRGVVAQRFPFSVRYTFTLLHFARLLEAGREADPGFVVQTGFDLHELARIGRSQAQSIDDATIDIGDPVAIGSEASMRRCADTIRSAIAAVWTADARI